jgi:hypothetical protein
VRRELLLIGLLCLSLPGVVGAQESAARSATKPWEKILGTWRQVPGPHDATSLKVEPEGNKVKISYACNADGSACAGSETAQYDGKPYQDSSSAVLSASFQKTSPRTLEENVYSSSKLVETISWQLSPDGKTLSRAIHSVSPPVPRDTKTIFDRNGGPTSDGDLFIGYWKKNWEKSDPLDSTFTIKGDVLALTNDVGIMTERNCDGKDHPDIVDPTAMYSCRFIDPQTYEMEFKKNEKVTFSLTRKISDDGKKMVVIRKNAQGKTMPEWTFEKVR